MSKFLVCSGQDIVELQAHDLSKDQAKETAQIFIAKGHKNVRIRMEDPNHPTWPLHFDNEKKSE